MRKRTVIAALTIVMMIFTLAPAGASAAQKVPAGEEYIESLEFAYIDYIKDRSMYCTDVWKEIQDVYKEGRASYLDITSVEEWYELPDYENMIYQLSMLTWVKSYADLKEVKSRYLKEINESYALLSRSEYNDYNWDMVQDGLYSGKKQINAAKTFRAAAEGYSEAIMAITYATTKEELKMYRDEYIDTFSAVLNLCLDPDDYSAPVWEQIRNLYKEGIAALNEAETEYDLELIVDEYLKAICDITGLTYPVTYEVIEKALSEIMRPVTDFYDRMSEADYTWERLDAADEILWVLEEDLYEIATRSEAEKLVNAALKKLKALPTREDDVQLYKNYVIKATAAGASGTSVKISWNANKNLDGYIIYRAGSRNGEYKEIKRIGSGKTKTYTDKKLTYGKNYYYKVKGIKSIDYKEKYTKLSAAVKGTPKLMAPAFKLSKTGSADVTLKWSKVPGAKGYQIGRATSVNGKYTKVKTITKGSTVQWKDTSTKKGKTYYYKMRTYSVKSDGTKKWSGYSAVKSIKR